MSLPFVYKAKLSEPCVEWVLIRKILLEEPAAILLCREESSSAPLTSHTGREVSQGPDRTYYKEVDLKSLGKVLSF